MKSIKDSFNRTYLKCITDKDAVGYTPGETVTFTIKLYGDGEVISAPFIEYELACDEDKTRVIHEYASGESGCITVDFKTTKPGFIKICAYACDENKARIKISENLHGGACAGLDEIRQYNKEPEDFDEFWANSLKLLPDISKVSRHVRVRELTDEVPEGYKSFEVVIPAVDDGTRPSVACFTYPADAEEGSLKIRISFQGYGVESPGYAAFPGYLGVSVSSHGIPVRMPVHYYNYDLLGIDNFGFYHNEKPETVYFRNMILRDIQMLRYAMTHPLWNGKDIFCIGGSMGAFQATAVSALMSDVVTELEVHINWMCDVGGEEIRLPGWRPTFTEALKYYDTINFARRVKAPINISTSGLGDYTSPPSGIAAYYNEVKAAGNTSVRITFVQNRDHVPATMPDSELLEYTREHTV